MTCRTTWCARSSGSGPGRRHQRQAHRGHRAVVESGRSHRQCRRHDLLPGEIVSPPRVGGIECQGAERGRRARHAQPQTVLLGLIKGRATPRPGCPRRRTRRPRGSSLKPRSRARSTGPRPQRRTSSSASSSPPGRASTTTRSFVTRRCVSTRRRRQPPAVALGLCRARTSMPTRHWRSSRSPRPDRSRKRARGQRRHAPRSGDGVMAVTGS